MVICRFGYADFDSADGRDKALELDGVELDGRTLRINDADKKPASSGRREGGDRGGGRGGGRGRGGFREGFSSPPSSTLIVRNLSYSTTEDSLADAFEGCTGARVVTDRDTGNSKGWVFGFLILL